MSQQHLHDVYIYDAVRSPRGKAKASGKLADLSPQELIKQLYRALLERQAQNASSANEPCGLLGEQVDERIDKLEVGPRVAQVDGLILGCVGQVNDQGGNIALVSKLHAGIAETAAAFSINNYCASGLTAVNMASAKIASGEWQSALAGGVEMMSRVPFLGDGAAYYSDKRFPKQNRFIPVALAADRLAAREGIDLDQLNDVALRSQSRASNAEQNPQLLKSRVNIRALDGSMALDFEECVRPQASLQEFAALTPAFGELALSYKEELGDPLPPALHTIAHAPPVCDGAGLVWLGTDCSGVVGQDISAKGLNKRARILATSDVGGDPEASLLAGFSAMDKVLLSAGLHIQDIGRIEYMEAFGVTIAKFLRDYSVDPERVNVSGGHIAKGHPLGATGAILLSTLLDALDESEFEFGLVVVTGAMGAGSAMLVQKL